MSRRATTRATEGETDELARQIMTWIGLSMRMPRDAEPRQMPEMESGMTLAQMHTLMTLAHERTVGVTALSERLHMSASAVSHLVHRLVEMDLVTRTEGRVDRRQRDIALATAGQRLVEQMMKARFQDMRASVQHLSPALKRELRGVLDKVLAEMTEVVQRVGPCGAEPVAASNKKATDSKETA